MPEELEESHPTTGEYIRAAGVSRVEAYVHEGARKKLKRLEFSGWVVVNVFKLSRYVAFVLRVLTFCVCLFKTFLLF
jgi:hypothetical protein